MGKYVLGFAAALALAAGFARAWDDDFSKIEIKPAKVAGSIWMLEGAGGNIGASAGPDGLLIIDDQYLPLADKITAALKGISPDGKLAFVVNTHVHGNHTGGNRVFGKEATIIAQENVRKRMSSKQERGGRTIDASPKEALPVVTFEDGVSIWFNGEQIEIVHVPHGHTDGDAIVYFKGANVVHMGDQYFNGMFPFIDTASGGDVAGYIKNVAELKAFHTMLTSTSGIARDEIAKGMSLEEAKKAGLPDAWKS